MLAAAIDRPGALSRYYSSISTILAFLLEERVCRLASEQCPSFIRALDNSSNDGAVAIDSKFIQRGEGPADSIFTFLRNYPENVILALVDVKKMSYGCDNKGSACHSFVTTRTQRENTHALILASPFDPDYVAIVPMHYIPPTRPKDCEPQACSDDEREETTSLPTIWPMWSLQEVPAFGPEYTAFVRPITQLGRAFENMHAHLIDHTIPWVNDYTGAVFEHPPPRPLSDSSGISPGKQQMGTYNAMLQVRQWFEAFRDYSERYRVELVGVAPLIADLKLVKKDTLEVVVFVELKRVHSRLIPGLSGSEILQHQQAASEHARLIFNWKVQWDFIFTATANKPDTAFLFPRGQIPASWWNIPYSKPFQLQMTDGFQQYRVDTGSMDAMVRDIEAILVKTKSINGSMEALDLVPLGYNSVSEPGEKRAGVVTDVPRPQQWGLSNPMRGFGFPEQADPRAYAYEVWVSEVINEMCRATKRGLVLDFGIWNGICHYAICDFKWSDQDTESFDKDGKPPKRVWNLPKITEVAPLSFTRHLWTGHWAPVGTSQSENQSKGIGQRPPSLVVSDLYSTSCIRLKQGRFVFPSEFLKTFKRNNRDHLQQGRGAIDEYLVEHDNLIDALLAPLRGYIHDPTGSGEIRAADYCQTLETIRQAGLDGIERHLHAMRKKYRYE
ncbi:MAG: hypothetical protein Q9200_003424 [Gallowayella weberi]